MMSKVKTPIKKAAKPFKGIVISNPTCAEVNSNLQLLRVTITDIETKVDFGYQATSYYIRGGWIKISPKTFIRPSGSNKKLILTNATNIPYGPEKLHFNSSIEWRYFSLHFPPIVNENAELEINKIDLIEQENGDSTDFNFYDIRLDEKDKKSLIY
jgi:hypothetical protein